MASLARGPPPLLKPETGHAPQVHTEAADAGAAARPGSREVKTIPQPPYKGGFGTPTNTPANPPPVAIAPRLGGGRPIGLSPGGGGGAPHAITPGNTPSSLETMGRRIAGKLQGNGCGGQAGGAGAAAGSSSARIAPSYERRFTAGLQDINLRLATHPEKPAAVDSPSSSMQRLQIVSPASTDQGRAAEWPTSFDTGTNDGEAQEKEEKEEKKGEGE